MGGGQWVKSYIPIADAIITVFGEECCEVVLHDLLDPGHSIVYIRGNLTGRKIGGPVTEVLLQKLKDTEEGKTDSSYYRTKYVSDRVFKSSTTFIRNNEGTIVGCLCINYDISDLEAVLSMIQKMIGESDSLAETPKRYHDNSRNLIEEILTETRQELGFADVKSISKSERMELIRRMHEKGAFAVQKSAALIAEILGVSRITIYNYLKELGWRKTL